MERLNKQELNALAPQRVIRRIRGRSGTLFANSCISFLLFAFFAVMVTGLIYGWDTLSEPDGLAALIVLLVIGAGLCAAWLIYLIRALIEFKDYAKIKLVFVDDGIIFWDNTEYLWLNRQEIVDFECFPHTSKYMGRNLRRESRILTSGDVIIESSFGKTSFTVSQIQRCQQLLLALMQEQDVREKNASIKSNKYETFIDNSSTATGVGISYFALLIISGLIHPALTVALVVLLFLGLFLGVFIFIIKYSIDVHRQENKDFDKSERAVLEGRQIVDTPIVDFTDPLGIINPKPRQERLIDAVPPKERFSRVEEQSFEELIIARLNRRIKELIMPLFVFTIFAGIVIGVTYVVLKQKAGGYGVFFFDLFILPLYFLTIGAFVNAIIHKIRAKHIMRDGRFDYGKYLSSKAMGGKYTVKLEIENDKREDVTRKSVAFFSRNEALIAAQLGKKVPIKRIGNAFLAYLIEGDAPEETQEQEENDK